MSSTVLSPASLLQQMPVDEVLVPPLPQAWDWAADHTPGVSAVSRWETPLDEHIEDVCACVKNIDEVMSVMSLTRECPEPRYREWVLGCARMLQEFRIKISSLDHANDRIGAHSKIVMMGYQCKFVEDELVKALDQARAAAIPLLCTVTDTLGGDNNDMWKLTELTSNVLPGLWESQKTKELLHYHKVALNARACLDYIKCNTAEAMREVNDDGSAGRRGQYL